MIHIAIKVIITLLPCGCKHHKVTCREIHVLPAYLVNRFSQLSRNWGHPPSGDRIVESMSHAAYGLYDQSLAQSWDGFHYLLLG